VEERRRGEDGYAAWSLRLIEMGLCPCEGCGGHLEGGICISCGCGHHIDDSRFYGRIAPWIPNHVPGRCSDADARRAEEARERERQARRRDSAEALGDPRR